MLNAIWKRYSILLQAFCLVAMFWWIAFTFLLKQNFPSELKSVNPVHYYNSGQFTSNVLNSFRHKCYHAWLNVLLRAWTRRCQEAKTLEKVIMSESIGKLEGLYPFIRTIGNKIISWSRKQPVRAGGAWLVTMLK